LYNTGNNWSEKPSDMVAAIAATCGHQAEINPLLMQTGGAESLTASTGR
jgi:hypothetical protein